MPLVIPGITNTTGGGNEQEAWMTKLLGKKISDTTSDSTSFSKQDLPKEHRILEPGAMTTQDHKPDRLSIHLAEDGTVAHVEYK